VNDSLARFIRSLAFMVAGGALQPLVDAFLVDLNDRYDPYVIVFYGLLINAVVLLVEEWKSTGIMRTPTPPEAKPEAPLN
jgi:hypothetical protein